MKQPRHEAINPHCREARLLRGPTGGYSQAVSKARRCLLLVLGLAGARAFAQDDIKISTEPFPGSDVPYSAVEATIDARPEEVWEILSNCANYSKTMPRIARSAELWREG